MSHNHFNYIDSKEIEKFISTEALAEITECLDYLEKGGQSEATTNLKMRLQAAAALIRMCLELLGPCLDFPYYHTIERDLYYGITPDDKGSNWNWFVERAAEIKPGPLEQQKMIEMLIGVWTKNEQRDIDAELERLQVRLFNLIKSNQSLNSET